VTQQSFEIFANAVRNRLYARALHITADNASADDMVQDTLLKLWTLRDSKRDPNTKEVTYSYNTFVIKNNASLLDEIEQAIVQERENSIKFEKYRDITTVKFKDGTSYTLNRNSANKGTFYVEKYSRNIRKKK
jgi:hypothetical protein